jgi:flagellar biosynthetic protein FlhB
MAASGGGGNDSGQEKTLEPSQKKLREAREQGQIPRSREITTVITFAFVLCFFSFGRAFIERHLLGMASFFLTFRGVPSLTLESVPSLFVQCTLLSLPLILPILFIVFFAGLSAEMAQVGIQSVKDPFDPKWDKLNPMAGLKRIFSLKQFVEGVKSVLKLGIFTYVIVKTLMDYYPQMVVLSDSEPNQGLQLMLVVSLKMGIRTCIVLAFLAGADYFFQRWQHMKSLRMTPQELKDEIRQSEGDPVLRARMRSLQMKIMRNRMMSEVPKSDVVIVNPTHYAVALRYDPSKSDAPLVVAKGQNYVALRIRELAEEAHVPIVENPPLARALFRQVKIDHPVPSALFKAVAQILASVYALAHRRGCSWALAVPVRQAAARP